MAAERHCTWEPRDGLVPAIVAASWSERQWPPRSGRITHPLWVLDYSRSAFGRCRVGSAHSPWRERGANIAHLYPPGVAYWEEPTSPERTIRAAYVLFTGGQEAGLWSRLRPGQVYARFHDPEGRLEALLQDAAEIGHRQREAGFWAAQGVLARIIELLLKAVPGRGPEHIIGQEVPTRAPQEVLATRVQEYLETHFREKLTLAAVAAALHVSRSTLSHSYQTVTGESPLATLIRIRVRQARGLLLAGLRLEAVAAATGFHDAFHLSRTFKQQLGISPRDFRKQSRLRR